MFDLKTLLPGLLHVEDRASMANSIESRVPLLDIELFNFVNTIPAKYKFKDGKLKGMLVDLSSKYLPKEVYAREDKMGFPVPINSWFKNELREYVLSIFKSSSALNRDLLDYSSTIKSIESEGDFDRSLWGAMNLEMWHKVFIDKHSDYKRMLE